MKLLVVLLPALSSGLTGSHVQVSVGGATYQHGAKIGQHPTQTTAYHQPAPAYHTPAPTYHTPAPTYHTPASNFHKPAPAYHTLAPVYHKPAPQYHTARKQNCSVVDEVVKAKVCTPAFETKCESVDLRVKTIVDKEQCQDITRTVCTVSDEVIENKICVYDYEKQSEHTVATTVEVTYNKECTSKKVTVCQPGQGYHYQSYGRQYCKEEPQTTCYNVPKVTPMQKKVSVVFPSPVKSCSDKPISLPRVSCEDLIENKCITVPEVEEEVKSVEKCEVSLAEPSCQYVELTLPKQVCVDLQGHTQSLTAKQYHARVL